MIRQGTGITAIITAAAMATGCSVSSPVRLSLPLYAPLPGEVSLDLGGEPSGSMTAFANNFSKALASQGVKSRPDAPYHLAIALSQRDSTAGVTQDKGGDPTAISWRSAPRKSGMFDGCKPQRLRAVVIGGAGLTADPALRAGAELDTCKDHKAELTRLAQALASAITRR